MNFLTNIWTGALAKIREEWDAALRAAADDVARENQSKAATEESSSAPSVPLTDASRETGVDFDNLAKLLAELDFYKRRSQSYFGLIERMQVQREEWKELYRRDASGHQHAQATLQEHIIQLRQQVVGALRLVNELRKKDGLPSIDLSAFALTAPPVGIAEVTKARNEEDMKNVPVQIDGQKEAQTIDETIRPPDGVVDEAHGAA